MYTAIGIVNGIRIANREERLCKLVSSLCSGTIYKRISSTIGLGRSIAAMDRLQPGRVGRVCRWVRPTEVGMVAMAVATRHNPWASAPYKGVPHIILY